MLEVADIFRTYGSRYRQENKLPTRMLRAMDAIESCRTEKLGGHIDQCDNCGNIKISYNSCRNRHCPKCQNTAREKWLIERKKELLPIGYVHVVLTVPQELNDLIQRNQKQIYKLLFKASSETLLELSKDTKYLGADIGFISILHTWGQNLMYHPHIHCIVSGGGLSLDSDRWINTKKRFFIPVKVLSRVFRGKFLAYLKEINKEKKLDFVGKIGSLQDKEEFNSLIDKLYKKEWIVYCKPPFNSPENVLEYLGRYTHRVAISNNRIIDIKNNEITFKYKDYKDNDKNKKMKISAEEFIRRFLLHILPVGFVKIRHYGIISNRNKKSKLKQCKKILEVKIEVHEKSKDELSLRDILIKILGKDPSICCRCSKGRMVQKEILNPKRYIPPQEKTTIVA